MWQVPVVTKEFLTGVKTEGLVTMIRQHLISEWGAEGSEEKVVLACCWILSLRSPIIFLRWEKHERHQRLPAWRVEVSWLLMSFTIWNQKGLVPLCKDSWCAFADQSLIVAWDEKPCWQMKPLMGLNNLHSFQPTLRGWCWCVKCCIFCKLLLIALVEPWLDWGKR